jgi:hypothetical protein
MITFSDCNTKASSVLATVTAAIAIATLVFQTDLPAFAAPPGSEIKSGLLPSDLALPASPPSQEKWLREANILQPYGHSAFVALTDIKDRPARLKKEFGFNAIIVQPPDSHNTIAAPVDKLTEQQFTAGIAAYRGAGYRIMLYTSVMALGLSPEFQSGQVSRDHPDWLQRDPMGNPVLVYGVPWLCPSSGAREAALDRCLRIAREYNADAILLDNNQFFSAAAGWTCHCDACTKAFRDYLHKRFGNEKTAILFGAVPVKLQIPAAEGPLYFEWLHWRNRVWADINESFRARLRKQNPSILLFANTQYAFENGMLATDQQYAREDIVVSESCELASRQMSTKMVLGHAMSAGQPLWNYIGTFAKSDDYTGLRAPEAIGPAIAATLAHNARPWIVDGFDEGPTNPQSRELMSKLLAWHATHQQLFHAQPYSAVATIISTESRNVRHSPLIPPHVSALQSAGIPVIALRDEALRVADLRPFQVVTVETADCLPAESATALAAWVREGGTLIAAPSTAGYDELGRQRTHSLLWQSLELDTPPTQPRAIDKGKVIAVDLKTFAATATRVSQPYAFIPTPDSGAEVVAYRTATSLILHIICHEKTGEPVSISLHKTFVPNTQAQLYTPGSEHAESLPLTVGPEGASLTVPHAPLYCVVEIPLL